MGLQKWLNWKWIDLKPASQNLFLFKCPMPPTPPFHCPPNPTSTAHLHPWPKEPSHCQNKSYPTQRLTQIQNPVYTLNKILHALADALLHLSFHLHRWMTGDLKSFTVPQQNLCRCKWSSGIILQLLIFIRRTDTQAQRASRSPGLYIFILFHLFDRFLLAIHG